jgi:hypothetical protein
MQRRTEKSIISSNLELINLLDLSNNINTVKPVYNGHPWDSEKVSVVQRLRQSGRYSQFVPIKLLSVL